MGRAGAAAAEANTVPGRPSDLRSAPKSHERVLKSFAVEDDTFWPIIERVPLIKA